MAIFKCKMCGGALEISGNETVAVCDYCGTQQTLPRLDDDRKANLYDRANHFRRNNEFDKAMGIYEQILNEDSSDAEAYWSLVLCRYGIEYVEDPTSHKRVPTVNRAQFTSVFDDDNYKSALMYADFAQRSVYEAEAKAINEIQKGILAISQNEEPFDVFICYKESDNNGRRTPDSVLANDLYHQLTNEGFKVFFARITLEDKLGTAYEPYIFAALNSAKVMVVLGTRPEYFNAVWVKNEWSRYLALIKNGAKKVLVPAYRDMDPYDLPEEFSHLQAQDMSKLGFMQDLIRGIKKIAGADEPKPTVVKETVVSGGSANVAPLLERAFMFLEDGDWASADEYCEKVLDQEPKNAQAYLGKMLASLRARNVDVLRDQKDSFENNAHYQKVLRFADAALCKELEEVNVRIKERNTYERCEPIYTKAVEYMNMGILPANYRRAAEMFESIGGYKDAAEIGHICREKEKDAEIDAAIAKAKEAMKGTTAQELQKAIDLLFPIRGKKNADELFLSAKAKLLDIQERDEANRKDGVLAKANNLAKSDSETVLKEAIQLLRTIPGWKDADELIAACQSKIEEITEAERIAAEKKAEAERAEQKKRKTHAKIFAAVLLLVAALAGLYFGVLEPRLKAAKYDEAVALMEAEEYDAAISLFTELGDYGDAANKLERATNLAEQKALLAEKQQCYETAEMLLADGKTVDAAIAFGKAIGYEDAWERSFELWETFVQRNSISAGSAHTIGLKADGTVVSAGSNYFGQRDTRDWSNVVSVVAGSGCSLGLRSGGTIVSAGLSEYLKDDVIYWTNIVAVAASHNVVGLKADGTVVSTADHIDFSGWNDIVAVAVGADHTVGLRADGTVVAVGNGVNNDSQCDVSGWNDIVAIAAGDEHTVGLKADGTVVATGNSEDGRCDVESWNDIVAVAAGYAYTVGLKSDGTLVAVGSNNYGQCDVEVFSDIVAIAAGSFHTVGLKADGTVVAVGNSNDYQCSVSSWTDIKLP